MGSIRYFALLFILFLNTLGHILLAFGLTKYFRTELIMVLIFFLIAIIIIVGVYKNRNWAWKLATIYFLAFMINNFLLYLGPLSITSKYSLTTLLSAIGFVISTINIKREEESEEEIEIEPPKEVKVKPYGEKKNTEFTPGKYVASKTGSVYHAPKCDWAKKINTKNRVWLEDKAEAKNKGYNKHSCVK